MNRAGTWLLLVILAGACGSRGGGGADAGTGRQDSHAGSLSENQYAQRFLIEDLGGLRLLHVFNPWQKSRDIRFTYVLGPDTCEIPDSLRQHPFIPVPVSKVVVLSTTHAAMITALGREPSIVGASGTGYIYHPGLRERVRNGQVKEVGSPQGLNYEALVSVRPDVVFVFGVDASMVPSVEKMKALGLRVVYCAEYLEDHPLGKAEWIRFFASFYAAEETADASFSGVAGNYRRLKELAAGQGPGPDVLLGLPWKDSWYVAGGNSFAARLIGDAGGSYLWEDLESSEAVPLDLESVYARAVAADIWINPGAAESLGDLTDFDQRFESLPVILNGKVFNNNARMSPGGGNDYWESATVYPDRVLADLISIFHPGILPDHSLIYYRELK